VSWVIGIDDDDRQRVTEKGKTRLYNDSNATYTYRGRDGVYIDMIEE
jgi:hypothetical protein